MAKKDDLDTKVSRDDIAYARKYSQKRSFKRWFVLIAIIIASTYLFYGWLYQNTATVRFKVIAVLEVDGEVKEFSNVMQVEYTRYDRASGLGYGGSSKTWGEALVIDLGERGRAYLLRSRYFENQSWSVFESGILRTYGIPASAGNLKKEHIQQLNNLSGRKKFTNILHGGGENQPSFVVFDDELNPNSISLLLPDDFGKRFGREVKFKRIDVEITTEPITENFLVSYLPWLSNQNKIEFEKMPPSHERPKSVSDWPLRWLISYKSFYAKESR